MKKSFIAALAVVTVIATQAHADAVSRTMHGTATAFNSDAQLFGNAVEGLSTRINNEMASGAVQIVTGPTGETIKLVGGVTAEAASYIAGNYDQTADALKCVASNPLNPFSDGGCVVQFAGQTLVFAVATAGDGVKTIVIGTANILAQPFEGFKHVMNSAANATGRMNNPIGAFFVLAYTIADGGEKIIRFALVDVVAKTVTVLADNGTKIVTAPFAVLYDIVTLRWDAAGVKIISLPFHLLNSVVNVPTQVLFNEKNVVMRVVSPVGRWVDRQLGINERRARHLEYSK